MGRLDQPPLLPIGGHPLPWIGGVAAPGTALHFDEHRGVAVARNNVELRSPPSPVSGEDAVPQTFQMCHSPLLALLAFPDATFQNHGTRVVQPHEGRSSNAQAGAGNGSAQDQVGGAYHRGSFEDVHHVGSCRQCQAPRSFFGGVEDACIEPFPCVINGPRGAALGPTLFVGKHLPLVVGDPEMKTLKVCQNF